MDNVFIRSRDLGDLVHDIRDLVLKRALELASQDRVLRTEPPPLLLELPCTLFGLKTDEEPLASDISRGMRFAPHMLALAAKILQRLSDGGTRVFNGAHMRIEKDATDWVHMMGGFDLYYNSYFELFKQADFQPDTPLYLASGLMSYSNDTLLDTTLQRLSEFSSNVVFKVRAGRHA